MSDVHEAARAPGSASGYVHGTAPEEQARLAELNRLINALSLEALAPRPGERVLDVGAGLGQLARSFARATGVKVVAIERSAEQLTRARQLAAEAGDDAPVEWRQGDALAMPIAADEWGTFDVAHARFLLEHVTDPQAVVATMARAVRRGGRVVLQDDDHAALRLWPEPASVALVWSAYMRTYDRLGCDPFVGRRLVQLLAGAGLTPGIVRMLPFGAGGGDPAFPAFVSNLANIYRGAREAILATGGCTAAQFDEALAALAVFARRTDGAFWYGCPWAEGVKP